MIWLDIKANQEGGGVGCPFYRESCHVCLVLVLCDWRSREGEGNEIKADVEKLEHFSRESGHFLFVSQQEKAMLHAERRFLNPLHCFVTFDLCTTRWPSRRGGKEGVVCLDCIPCGNHIRCTMVW